MSKPSNPRSRRVIISADDFGLSVAVNEAIELAHTQGLLSTASLMIAGDAADDAIARARRLPTLHVGLHLVVVEGPAILPPAQIPLLVDGDGQFSSQQFRLGLDYFFRPAIRRQLAREMAAQFEAFAATGLPLDHANAHKHMHLHPVVGRELIKAGMRHGLRAVRVPTEPAAPLRAADGTEAGRALRQWTRLLRHQVRSAGLATNDYCFGLAWSGGMTIERVCALAAHLPPGLSEIYFHPAMSNTLRAELATLCAPDLREVLTQHRIIPTTWRCAGS